LSLPVVSGRRVIRALAKIGFEIVGRKESHIRMKKKDGITSIVIIPDHMELARGTLGSIMRQANLSREEFLEILEKK